MAIDYTMPKLAMAMNEGTINEWLLNEGDYVEKGGVLATIETEKVSYDVESPDAGYLHIIVAAGETVDCEVLVAKFAESEEELAELQQASAAGASTETPAAQESGVDAPTSVGADAGQIQVAPAAAVTSTQGGGRIKASPLARKLATDVGLNLALLTGTGPGGRIVKRDVLSAQERGVGMAAATVGGDRILAKIPMQGMRKTIASRMTQSLQEAAQLSSGWESDITELLAVRKRFVAREEQLGTRVSMNAFLIKAMACAIKQVPIANSCLEGDELVIYDNINMGIAISVPGSTEYDSGLMVAVLRNVEHMGVVEIDIAMKALITRIREGKASAEDMSGSTITLSSTAGLAPPGMTTTPVLNLPNAALLGPSTPIERPMLIDGQVVPRTLMPLSFTFDHRMLDGEPAARFMKALHDCLEHPELMLA
ncbi:MAG: dihydrolipoamide acetyltransferase family protein [Gammaproteobacteria bacterium]|nr:dihydrolipoamide acetyltransferase family protein [Gammaproteobacteria bacterium]